MDDHTTVSTDDIPLSALSPHNVLRGEMHFYSASGKAGVPLGIACRRGHPIQRLLCGYIKPGVEQGSCPGHRGSLGASGSKQETPDGPPIIQFLFFLRLLRVHPINQHEPRGCRIIHGDGLAEHLSDHA
jgi:hypothetical protein